MEPLGCRAYLLRLDAYNQTCHIAMRVFRAVSFCFVLFVATFWLSGCAKPEPAASHAAQTAPAERPAASEETVLYVDVRTPEEFAAGHVEGALLIPHDQMASRWSELAPYRDREIRLYCRSGRRSGIAEQILVEQGFTNVVNAGAFEELRAAGVPVVLEE